MSLVNIGGAVAKALTAKAPNSSLERTRPAQTLDG
jgi:hypothetical protein